jgi:hypothetical protein
MRGQRPFVKDIAPELDALIAQACMICECATMPTHDDIAKLRKLGKAWDDVGRPLLRPEKIEWLSPGGNRCWFSEGYDPNKIEPGWKQMSG